MKLIKKMTLWLLLISFTLVTLPVNVFALEKNETVYAKLGHDGRVKNIVVNEQLINNDKLNKIEDYSELKDILNIKNDNKFTTNNNKITWDAKGSDVFYKGTTNNNLPIDLDITYMLDDKEYKVEDMLGKSGRVTIELKYTNNDKHGDLYTPFVVTLGTIIDGKNNSNIEIVNGKAVNNGSNYVVVGIATPGLYQSLGFEELKNMDTITISYDTTKFELSSMYSVVTSKLLDNNDLSIFDKMDGIYKDIDTLQDSMNQIEEGSNKLSSGINTLHTSYYEFNSGVNLFNANFYTLNNGVNQLHTGVTTILNNDKVKEFRKYLPKLEEDANKIKEITNYYSDDINNYLDESDTAVDGITSDILNIISYLEEVNEYLDDTGDYTTIINDYTNSINNSLDEISEFISVIENYIDTINKLSSFSSKSSDYIIKIYEANPEGADEELTSLYNEAINMKNTDITNTTESLNSWKNNLEQLKIDLDNAKNKLNNVSEKVANNSKLNSRMDSVRASSDNLKEVENKVKDANKNIHTGIDKIRNSSDVINELPNKINEISNGIDTFENGINAISDGTNKLYEGSELLKGYSNQIYDGISLLNSGSNELSEGISMFNREGINRISNLVNNDVKLSINKVHRLIELGNDYSSFGGTNTEGTTKFIMLIDSLEVPEENKTIENTKKISFWDRIINLFK